MARHGKREEFRRWLAKDHPIRWAWDTFARRRAEYEALFADPALGHLVRHRLRHPQQAAALIEHLCREGSGGHHAATTASSIARP